MDMRGELQLLRDPVRLANEGMLLVKKKGSAIFFSEDKGKFIVSLQELPFNEHWITPGGHELVRVARRQVTFIVVGSYFLFVCSFCADSAHRRRWRTCTRTHDLDNKFNLCRIIVFARGVIGHHFFEIHNGGSSQEPTGQSCLPKLVGS